jgi:RHS repeat-associated protein
VYGSRSNTPDLVLRDGKTYRLISDQLGSPRYAVNVANKDDVPYQVSYGPWGAPTVVGGLAASTISWIPFGFAGGLYDADTGLVHFGAREYDASVGRWVSKDPSRFHGGTNLYMYSWNDPVNFRDRTGRRPTGAGGAPGTGEGGSEGTGGIPWTPAPHATPWPLGDRDWCGSVGTEWVPESDPLGSSNFQSACRTHDDCYGQCGSDKFDCDWNLGHDMQDQCVAQGDPCNVAGLVYFGAVYVFADAAFNNAQADCTCGGP